MCSCTCTTPSVAFSAAGTRSPGLAIGGFPCRVVFGELGVLSPLTLSRSPLRMP